MWQRWYMNQCVGVGWHPSEGYSYSCENAKDAPYRVGWSKCRNQLKKMVVGDNLVVTLADSRIARIGQITGFSLEDGQWDPLVPPSKSLPNGEIGRRVLVRWRLDIGPDDRDLVVSLPEGQRLSTSEFLPTIAEIKSRQIDDLVTAMNDQSNWVNLLGHFGYEKALSDYIAAYPYRLEDGLLRHPSDKVRERVFDDRRRLDVLLVDREGRSVIVECKQQSPTKEDCDQLCHYLAKLKEETGSDARGILVHGGSAKLRTDISTYAKQQSIEIVRYSLDVDFTPCA
jgi:hypothetical protein